MSNPVEVGTSSGNDSGVGRMLTGMLRDSHLSTLEQLPALVNRHCGQAGLGPVHIYLTDLQQRVLRLLPSDDQVHDADKPADELNVDTTLAGRAYQEVRVLPKNGADTDAPEYWWVPLLDGTERLGLLRVAADDDGSGTAVERMVHLASLVALMLVSVREYSDSYARLVRTRPMHVAAEMQWNLMPPLTFADDRVVIGGALEPAYEIGGDALDYALSGDLVHVAIFDAMGHDVAAGLAANLAVAACRNLRREGAGPAATSEGVERVLLDEFGPDTRFVTAIIAHLDARTGHFSWVNRGHHPPVVIRGGRWSTMLPCPPAHPMGLDLGVDVIMCTEQLEPGDRVLFYTDGITEARNRNGREFGLHRFVDFIVRHNADGLPVPETLRRLVQAVLDYHDGELGDDASVLLLEWNGPDHPHKAVQSISMGDSS